MEARWIWDAGESHPRNYWARFRKSLDLHGAPDEASLSINADSRYVAWVNGIRVGQGPGAEGALVSPSLGDLPWAKGSVPTPRGRIDIRAERRGGRVVARVRAPQGVELVAGPGVLLESPGMKLVEHGFWDYTTPRTGAWKATRPTTTPGSWMTWRKRA